MSRPWPPEGTTPLSLDVVSVQSQVIYGRVGNNVALPTLAALGLTATAVPTVLLSNTPHYASLHGGGIPLDWFAGFLEDLVLRGGLHRLRAVLSGYLGSAEQARALAAWIRRLKGEYPALRIVIDPVIGDHDHGVYVAPELVDAHRDTLLPLASGLTPNSFELTQLTGRPAASLTETAAGAHALLAGSAAEWLIVTSAAPEAGPPDRIRLVLAERSGTTWLITHPRIAVAPKGTGDLFNASVTAGWISGQTPLDAARSACQRVLHALRLTQDARCAELLLPDGPGEAAGAEIRAEPLAV